MSELLIFDIKDFVPVQPGFEMNTHYYIEYKERNINGYSMLFYQFKLNESDGSSLSVIPDGCIDILFCCNREQPFATVCGSVLESKRIKLHESHEYFGVRFLPKQELKFSKYSIKEMVENEVPLHDIISIDETIIRKIIHEKDFHARIKLFKQMIGDILFTSSSSTHLIRYALKRMYSSKGNLSINQLAEEVGYSTRYVRKQFEQCVGISPKLFCQIVRFQSSLYMLMKLNQYTIWDVIDEMGYYDQAHLINEFKKFGYVTPTKLMRNNAKIVV